jgi:two-component system chemotaxis sensor kinase CheA
VNALNEVAARIDTVPADFLEDCSDEIIKSGAQLTLYTDVSVEAVRNIIADSLYVKSFEVRYKKDAPEEPETNETAPAEEPAQPVPESAAAAGISAAAAPSKPAARAAAPPAPPPEVKASVINVNVEKLDKLMDLMGEIVISVAMVIGSPDLEGLKLDTFEKSASQLLKNTNELQNVIMSVRMIPISSTFHKMTRIVRDTAKKLGKEAELIILGEETEVDKNIIDSLGDPLMHIVRNSMDHGLEDAKEDRVKAGKNPVGRITLEARNSGSDVIISCTDDGRGLDRERILAKAKRNGLLTRPESDYTDREIYQFIMGAGFSTNEQVTELSGRGVGMDVVKKNIEKIGGTIQLESEPGQGMTVAIRIPLTLAILQSIEIQVGSNLYLIPTLNIRESFKPKHDEIITDPEGNEMILFRGECFPIIRLGRLFGVPCNSENFEDGIIIMVEDEGRMAGLFADVLVSEQQAVVKPIPSFITERIGQIRGISGCTIMGNGNIDLIIDVKSLTQ